MLMVGSLFADAQTVNFSTNLPEATRVGVSGEYGPTFSQWEEDGKLTLNVTSYRGVDIQVNTGYYMNSVTINGSVYSAGSAGSVYIEKSQLPEGAEVVITASVKKDKYVVINADPTTLQVTYNYQTFPKSAWKNNQLSIKLSDMYSTITVASTVGYAIKSVKYHGDECIEEIQKSYIINPMVLSDDENVFDIESINLVEGRTSEFTLDIDGDSSDIEVELAGDRGNILTGRTLEMPIKFNPEYDLPVYIRSIHYDRNLYKVSVDGVEIPSDDHLYRLYDLKNGDVVKVEVDFPDVQVPIRISYVNPDTEASIQAIYEGGVIIPSEEWMAEGWTMPLGTNLIIRLNVTDYIVSATLDGVDFDQEYISFTVMNEEGYDFVVTAEPREPFLVKFYYDKPANFKVKVGNLDDDLYSMNPDKDETVVPVPRNRNRVTVIADEGYEVKELWVGNDQISSRDFMIWGDTDVYVFMEEYKRDLEAVVYLDPATEWNDHASLTLSPGKGFREKDVQLSKGYNLFRYNEEDLPVRFEVTYQSEYDYVAFENGAEITPTEEMFATLVPGTVVKCFGSYPEFYNVSFTVEDGAGVTIYRNMIDEYAPEAESEEMAGTLFEIVPEDVTAVIVNVNGVQQVLADGKYSVNVHADTDIEVKKGDPTGIANIGEDDCVDVYSLQGIRVLKNVNVAKINTLPAGIYIVSGRKIAVK